MIPCEFCGIQLEEEILFHHQVLNRICWATSHCSRMGPVPGVLWHISGIQGAVPGSDLPTKSSGIHVKGCAPPRPLLKSTGLI